MQEKAPLARRRLFLYKEHDFRYTFLITCDFEVTVC